MREAVATRTDLDLIIDSFAGGGGASLGIARALGREQLFKLLRQLQHGEVARG